MRELVTLLSAGLAVAGMLTAIGGVVGGEFKPVVIGFVLLAGAAVFALLRIGLRAPRENSDGSVSSLRSHEIEV